MERLQPRGSAREGNGEWQRSIIIQFNSILYFNVLTQQLQEHNNNNNNNKFIYVLDNSQKWPITAKHKNNSTG
jgi:hypothetical protein